MSDSAFASELSRRRLLAAAGAGGLAAGAAGSGEAGSGSAVSSPPAPPVAGLHLQFGADASSQMTVSWHTLEPVTGGRVIVGRADGRLERTVPARTVSYLDAKSKRTVYAHHALIGGLVPRSQPPLRRPA